MATSKTKTAPKSNRSPQAKSVDRFDAAYEATPIFCDTLADLADDWPADEHRPRLLAQLWTCGGGDN